MSEIMAGPSLHRRTAEDYAPLKSSAEDRKKRAVDKRGNCSKYRFVRNTARSWTHGKAPESAF